MYVAEWSSITHPPVHIIQGQLTKLIIMITLEGEENLPGVAEVK